MRRALIFIICYALLGAVPAQVAADLSGKITVIDGDTFDVGGTRVRLFGIDAVEKDQDCLTPQGDAWRCGVWVRDRVQAAYEGKTARCTVLDTDRYGRAVARCRVERSDVGRKLVRAGLAYAYTRYSGDYVKDERAAAQAKTGLHASLVQAPAEFRQARASGRSAPDPACVIKGNISSKGERIYHSPGQQHYDRTGIRTNKGERWFCSRKDAEAAGWRAARR